MRLLWRISNHCDLLGMGGEKSDGGWHTAARGKRVVYLSGYPALAYFNKKAPLDAVFWFCIAVSAENSPMDVTM